MKKLLGQAGNRSFLKLSLKKGGKSGLRSLNFQAKTIVGNTHRTVSKTV